MTTDKAKISKAVKKEVKKEVKKDLKVQLKPKKVKKIKTEEQLAARYKKRKMKYMFGANGSPDQDGRVSHVLSAWDRMLLAKHFPGQFDAPYVAGMNTLPIPTSTAHTSLSIDKVVRATAIDGAREKLDRTYVVLAFAPSLTTYLGGGGTNQMANNVRLAGFQALQTNTQSDVVIYQNAFNRTTRGFTCAEIYGSDFLAFASAGFIWASEMSLKINAPGATVTGIAYEGAITLSQIGRNGLSVANLIKLAQKTHYGITDYKLKGAVVNHNLVFDIDHTTAEPADPMTDFFQDLSLETMHYLVFEKPVRPISGTDAVDYEFICTVSSNFAWWPMPTDPLAARLGTTETQADKYIDKHISDAVPREEFNWVDPLQSGVDFLLGFAPPGVKQIGAGLSGIGFGALRKYLKASHTNGMAGSFPSGSMGYGAKKGSINASHILGKCHEVSDTVPFLNKTQIQLDIDRLSRFLSVDDVPFSWKATWNSFGDSLESLREYIKDRDDVFPDDTIPPPDKSFLRAHPPTGPLYPNGDCSRSESIASIRR